MGNTPTHQPVEGDSPAGDDPEADASLRHRVAGAIYSIVAAVRRLFVGDPSRVEEPTVERDAERVARPPLPQGQRSEEVPHRDRPLTEPDRDRRFDNTPELESTQENGRLSIYAPEADDAVIRSDTWEQVER